MLAPIWQRAAHRGVPIFLVTALLLGQSPMALAESPAQRQELVAALRQLDALERMSQTAERARAPSHGQTRNFRYYVSQVYVWTESYLIAAAFTTLTFLVRLLVLVLTLPLIFTAAFVGLIDGLVRRDVRRFGAGRESGFIYHRAKASLMPLAVLPWVTYLALPISVHPLLILLPSAALLGLAVSLTAGSFKKYL